MTRRKLFPENENWYKGNLHTHTTLSDGRISPEEAIRVYRERGYSFLAITDHKIFYPGAEEDGFVLLGGTELNRNDNGEDRAWHIIGVGMERVAESDGSETPEVLAQRIVGAGGLAVLGHPSWSLLTGDDIARIAPYCFATEIYSGVSGAYSGRADSSTHCDIAAARGAYIKLLGVDDAHFYERDSFQAWIVMKLPELSRAAIMNALQGDAYYCSEGPEFLQVTLDGDTVTAETSPVRQIVFYSNQFYVSGRVAHAEDLHPGVENAAITTATYRIQPGDRHLRVFCEDSLGRKATTQYIKLRD